MKKPLLISGGVVYLLVAVACVSYRKFQDVQNERNSFIEKYNECKKELSRLSAQIDSLNLLIKEQNKAIEYLKQDTAHRGVIHSRLVTNYDKLTQLYNELERKYEKLLAQCGTESEELRMALLNKQEELNRKEKELKDREVQLNALQDRLKNLEADLQEREKRINELEKLIAEKDSLMQALLSQLREAFAGFKAGDIKVEMKEGNLYVSMSEKLLFKSGSIVVEPEGRRALAELAKVLRRYPELRIMVEGHTDNVPIHTQCMKDNWDLSVLRATSVIRILTQEHALAPERFIAAGRGEWAPVASNDTPEGRALNRRTEIIVLPPIERIMRLLGSQ